MRLKTKLALAVIPATAAVVAGTIVAIHLHRRRSKHATDFLRSDAREALRMLCSLEGSDFVPDSLGTSLYQRKLSSMSDRQLLGVYVAIKLAETLRARGVSLHQLSKDDLISEARLMHKSAKSKDVRHELLKWIGSLGVETAVGILNDALSIAGAIV